MLDEQVRNIIDTYYNGANADLYIRKSTEKIELPVNIVSFCESNNVEVKCMTDYENPSGQWYFTMGEYREDGFEIEYTSILTISKLANIYGLDHRFKVLNRDPKKIAPVLIGDAEETFNFTQFDFEEIVKQCFDGIGYTRMFWRDSERRIEGVNFAEGVTIFGPDVTQGDILFRDVLEILPD